ncbi:conserved hypothetical protein [Thiomonas sp. X19]|uniref:CopG family transcriptional regulator n=1 Tax=mine drainage metagenome TaxID=410659 RepID=E6PNC9_9ZZZZ|nr:hypothetical protein [Thiomonas sp. X19]SCC94851.1 conserved hypothetical protein [Thiomonas sp. X19]
MKMETIKRRLAKDRPMVAVTLRMPQDVVDDLKRVAPLRGFAGYQALLRAYVGAGLRDDMERFEGSAVARLIDRLRDSGVPEETLRRAAAEVSHSAP